MASNDTSKIRLGWSDIEHAAKMLAGQMHDKGYAPKTIVAVAKGGIIPAGLLLQYFPDAKLEVIKVHTYEGTVAKESVLDSADLLKLRGFNEPSTLIMDDICDTGRTYLELTESGLGSCKFAALYVRDQEIVAFECDFYGWGETTSDWLVFPWEPTNDE